MKKRIVVFVLSILLLPQFISIQGLAESLFEPVEYDTFNEYYYFKTEPEEWLGPVKPYGGVIKPDVYYLDNPFRVLYSEDGSEWKRAYELSDDGDSYDCLPSHLPIDSYYFDWYGAFGAIAKDTDGSVQRYYTYDLINWHMGEDPKAQNRLDPLPQKAVVYQDGINRSTIFSSKKSGLYYTYSPYEIYKYRSNIGNVILSRDMCNELWVSDDGVYWVSIPIPDDMLYFTFILFRDCGRDESLVASCAFPLSEEEQRQADACAREAERLNQKYDKPDIRIKKYTVKNSKIKQRIAETLPAKQERIYIQFNGNYLCPDELPYLDENSRTQAPVRFIAEQLGATVDWLPETQEIRLTKGQTEVTMQVGCNLLTVNGDTVQMDTSPKLNGDRTFLPVRYVAEALGYSIDWNQNEQTVIIL